MSEYPKFGTTPIECARRKCEWQGYETDRLEQLGMLNKKPVFKHVCPKCGHDAYLFLEGKALEDFKAESA